MLVKVYFGSDKYIEWSMQTKAIFLMAVPLRPYPPPPSILIAINRKVNKEPLAPLAKEPVY